jgi:carboxylate/amino acid/amine transporter
MIYLLIVSFIWPFSFGLIKVNLAGIDPNFAAFARLLIAMLVFAPFLRLKGLQRGFAIKLVFIGMIQFGVMYVTYFHSYQYLKAYEVALFTIFTPLYVTLIHDLLERRFHPAFIFTSLLAVAGAYLLQEDAPGIELRKGFLTLQVSNVCFAAGQVAYRKLLSNRSDVKDHHIFGLLYLGAALFTGICAGITTNWSELALTSSQVGTLVYLGLLASGVCFFLWNLGARKTNAGALAVFNNMKIPLGVACSLFIFGEEGDIPRLLLGGGIILGALIINEFLESRRKGS